MSENPAEFATVSWEGRDTPVSERFCDPYFAREEGREETRQVFIEGNDLPRRWQSMTACTIAELGFGTGLALIETLRAWRQAPGRCHEIRYVSFERYPMTRDDLARALSPWPEIDAEANRLLVHWPPPAGAPVHEVCFGGTTLELHLGDANTTLPKWSGQADAWYLDGFSPARNPELWGAELMAHVYAHTAPGGTFSTYTAAGWVRRNLSAAGFEVAKVPGFGRKRERLAGRRPA